MERKEERVFGVVNEGELAGVHFQGYEREFNVGFEAIESVSTSMKRMGWGWVEN